MGGGQTDGPARRTADRGRRDERSIPAMPIGGARLPAGIRVEATTRTSESVYGPAAPSGHRAAAQGSGTTLRPSLLHKRCVSVFPSLSENRACESVI
ncbi:hypothetical protein Shyhy01_48120 [Streptomyces hygroscopicus subsp. hygroscopicus]|nr:hypothetical protein Shyhy01_48120 [Streptomyces hygroscopicus subsp. hygroscopicus]